MPVLKHFSLSLSNKKESFHVKRKTKKKNTIRLKNLSWNWKLTYSIEIFVRMHFFFLEHHKKVHCPPSIIHTKILFPTPLGYARIALHEGRASHSNVQTSSVKPKVFMNRVFWLFLSVLGSSVSTSYVKVFKVPNN